MSTISTDYGKTVRKGMIDANMKSSDLCKIVSERTGKYFDCSYLSKICRGENNNATMVSAINEILGIKEA